MRVTLRASISPCAVAPAEVGLEAEELAAHSHVMPAGPVPRRREVVAKVLVYCRMLKLFAPMA